VRQRKSTAAARLRSGPWVKQIKKMYRGKDMDAAPKYEITQSIAVLSTEKSGWTKELNLIAWNGKAPKYDIRSWSPDHQKMGKGVTLSDEELSALKSALEELA